jgi:hypothetical protein
MVMVSLVPVFFTRTCAFGIAALEASVIRPVMVARKSCASEEIVNNDREQVSSTKGRMAIFKVSPLFSLGAGDADGLIRIAALAAVTLYSQSQTQEFFGS